MCFLTFSELDRPYVTERPVCDRFRSNRTIIAAKDLRFRTSNGKYIIDDYIGIGGQAFVATAYNLWNSDSLVVIKSMKNRPDERFDKEYGSYLNRMAYYKNWLRKEVEFLQQLNHPHIIRLLETWEQPGDSTSEDPTLVAGNIYQIIERFDGDLNSLVEQEIVTTVPQQTLVMHLARQIFSALHLCHERHGIMHRDVKPDNILCRMSPGWGRDDIHWHFALADFGLAKRTSDTLNVKFRPPPYMWYPPEYYSYPCLMTPAGDVWGFAMTILWLVNDYDLRSENVRHPMEAYWLMTERAKSSERWKNWAGIFEPDFNKRWSVQDLYNVTDSLRIEPNLEGTIPKQDKSHQGSRAARSYEPPVDRIPYHGRRCWHSEIRNMCPILLDPLEQCHCDKELLENKQAVLEEIRATVNSADTSCRLSEETADMLISDDEGDEDGSVLSMVLKDSWTQELILPSQAERESALNAYLDVRWGGVSRPGSDSSAQASPNKRKRVDEQEDSKTFSDEATLSSRT